MTTQSLTFSRLTAFTWNACFSRVKLIYTAIFRSIIIYDSITWHASHERSIAQSQRRKNSFNCNKKICVRSMTVSKQSRCKFSKWKHTFNSFICTWLVCVASSDTEAGLRNHVMWLQSRDVIKMTVHRAK